MKTAVKLFLILFTALLIRLINLDKSGGLWYDEMTIYAIASKSFPFGMLMEDAHRFLLFPLYYFIYNVWINIFGTSDFIIRLMSVFFDCCGVLSAYFAGRAFIKFLDADKKLEKPTGLIYALFYAFNSSFIYYAQEAKFYSVTFFIVNLFIISWLSFLKKPDFKRFLCFFLSSFFLIYTYTSQILLFLIVFVLSIFYLTAKKELKYIFLMPLVLVPVFIFMFFIKNYFSGNFEAVNFDNSFILLALEDFFTPLLFGVQNNIPHFFHFFITNFLNIKFLIFGIFPLAVMLLALFLGINKKSLIVFLVPLIYFSFHIILSNISFYNALVRYLLPILPFLLLILSYGIQKIRLYKVFITIFISISFLCITSSKGAVHIKRPDGYKPLAQALIEQNIPPEYDFIFPIRTTLFDKYFEIKGKKLSLYSLTEKNAMKTYLLKDEIQNIEKGDFEHYKRFLSEDKINPEFKNYVKENFFKGENLVIFVDKTICMFYDSKIKQIVKSPNFKNYPIQFLRLSKLNNNLIKAAKENYYSVSKIELENWDIYVFQKKLNP